MKLLISDTTSGDAIIISLNDKQEESLTDHQLMDGSLSLGSILRSQKEILWHMEQTWHCVFNGVDPTISIETINQRGWGTRDLADFICHAFTRVRTYA